MQSKMSMGGLLCVPAAVLFSHVVVVPEVGRFLLQGVRAGCHGRRQTRRRTSGIAPEALGKGRESRSPSHSGQSMIRAGSHLRVAVFRFGVFATAYVSFAVPVVGLLPLLQTRGTFLGALFLSPIFP